jgi:PAS domain S-box-containing protein
MNEPEFRLNPDSMPQLVWTANADGSQPWFNRRWLEYSGLALDDILTHGWPHLVHPEDKLRTTTVWSQALANCKTFEAEYRVRCADGSYRWMLGQAVPRLDDGGKTIGWLGTLTDIDSLKQTNDLLEKSLFMTQLAGRVARLGGWTIELPERKLTWSAENCLIHDVPAGYQPTLKEGISYFLPEHREQVTAHVNACAEHGTPYEFVLPKTTMKGRRIWVRSIGEAVRDAGGAIIRLQGAFQDITETREAELRTQALQTRLVDTLENITDGCLLIDEDWNISFLNGPAERMLRRKRNDLMGRKLWLEYPNMLGTSLETAYRLTVQQQQASRVEYFDEPLQAWLDCHLYPSGAGVVVYFRDTTQTRIEQAQLQAQQQLIVQLNAELEARVVLRTGQLAAANKELQSFAYSVSHDLRSPLNTIHAFSQLLLKTDSAHISDKGRHYLQRIQAGVEQMGGLIDGLLTLAHLARGNLKPGSVDLSAAARRVEDHYRAQEPLRQVSVNIQPGMNVQGDPQLLTAVLQHLMGNAWKFSSRRALAHIDIGCDHAAGGNAVFYVKDNGAGFDMAFAHKLFGTFERLHSPGDFPGIGIGLAAAKRVIELHGGRIWADSKPDQGATFYFVLKQQIS